LTNWVINLLIVEKHGLWTVKHLNATVDKSRVTVSEDPLGSRQKRQLKKTKLVLGLRRFILNIPIQMRVLPACWMPSGR
jgi:hypothetical protein